MPKGSILLLKRGYATNRANSFFLESIEAMLLNAMQVREKSILAYRFSGWLN